MTIASLLRRFAPVAIALSAMPACNLMCPYNADQVFETQVRAECHFYFGCCTVGEHDVLEATAGAVDFSDFARYRDEASCVQERLEEGTEANELFRAIVQAEQAGRFRYDATKAQACNGNLIDALNSCDKDFVLGETRPLEASEECSVDPSTAGGDGTAGVPGEGLVGDGDPCFFDFECAVPNSRCQSPIVLEQIESCTTDSDCRGGEECRDGLCLDEVTEVLITDEKICIVPLKEDDDCTPDADFPFLDAWCGEGLRCIADEDGDRSCQPPRFEGEDCFSGTQDCERGTYCDASGNGPECAPLKGEGDDCFDNSECEIGLFCDLARNEPSCEAPLRIVVEICDGIQGSDDPAYSN